MNQPNWGQDPNASNNPYTQGPYQQQPPPQPLQPGWGPPPAAPPPAQGGWPPPTWAASTPVKLKTNNKPLVLVGVGIVAVGATALLAAAASGAFTTTVLDQRALESSVTAIYTEDFKVTLSDLSCPANQKVAANTSFVCHGSIGGKAVNIPITVTDDNGSFLVDGPTGG